MKRKSQINKISVLLKLKIDLKSYKEEAHLHVFSTAVCQNRRAEKKKKKHMRSLHHESLLMLLHESSQLWYFIHWSSSVTTVLKSARRVPYIQWSTWCIYGAMFELQTMTVALFLGRAMLNANFNVLTWWCLACSVWQFSKVACWQLLTSKYSFGWWDFAALQVFGCKSKYWTK